MKKLIVAAVVLLTGFLNAQKLDNSLLWKISGNGLKQPSYLFGTMHITCDATLDKSVLTALDNTKQLYLEINMDDPALQTKMMDGAMMKDGQKMSTLASPEDYKIVSDFLNENVGMPAALLDRFKPSLVTMMLYPKMMECPAQSIEMELMNVTKTQNEPMFGLETIEHQLAIFDAIPYKEQMDELVDMAKNGLDAEKQSNKKLDAIYKSKNLQAIAAYMQEEENKTYGDHADILLDDRNASWIPKIEEAAKATPTFFGVGAAHLGGEKGVILLLRKKGYKVEAVK